MLVEKLKKKTIEVRRWVNEPRGLINSRLKTLIIANVTKAYRKIRSLVHKFPSKTQALKKEP